MSDTFDDFASFLEAYGEKLRYLFRSRTDIDALSTKRGLPPFVMREIRSCKPLSVVIPSEYGGRGGSIAEFLSVLAASSYESLALSLTMGINGGLFLQPVAKYGCEEIKGPIFDRFLHHGNLGGLMITEPDYGSDALNMQTAYVQQEGGYNIKGLKHWAGLTGWADFWIVTARERNDKGQLGRDVSFFVCDTQQPEQRIVVEELFENLGLYMIPYGRNRIDVEVPETHRLQGDGTGIKMMLDMLYRSRLQFPGMAMGFLKRMVDEAVTHCRSRFVGGDSLFNYDQVKERIARLQAAYTTCSAMCAWSSENAGVDRNLWKETVSANAVKSVVTDLMQDAAQSLLQLTGAKGYRLDHIAGRALVDSRPFQIFEGSNDILYQQISESVLKSMRRLKENNLYRYLRDYELTARAAERFEHVLDFEVDMSLPQRKLVELGRLLGRVVSMELVIELRDRGFSSDLASGALRVLEQDVKGFLNSFRTQPVPAVVEDYEAQSGWLDFVRPSST